MALWLTEIFETANKQRESYGKGQASLQRWRLGSENPLQVYVWRRFILHHMAEEQAN